MSGIETVPNECFEGDPGTVADQLRIAYVEVFHDSNLPKAARQEIARRTQDCLIEHMERHPELQVQPSDAYTMRFNY